MSRRQTKVLHEQALKYGLPFGGKTTSLPRVARALHDFLATNSRRLSDDDDLLNASVCSRLWNGIAKNGRCWPNWTAWNERDNCCRWRSSESGWTRWLVSCVGQPKPSATTTGPVRCRFTWTHSTKRKKPPAGSSMSSTRVLPNS